MTYKEPMAEGTSVFMFYWTSLNSVGQPIRVLIDLDKRDEEVGLLLAVNDFLSRAVQDPIVGRIGPLGGGPVNLACVDGGWAGGHDGGSRYEYLWGKKRGFNKVFLDAKRRRRQNKVKFNVFRRRRGLV